MKRGFILLFILILIFTLTFVSATTIKKNLKIGDSFIIEDKNVTLVKVDDLRDKILVCVNGEEAIISEDNTRRINEVEVTLIKVSKENATIKGYIECKNSCNCGVECSFNQVCFKKIEENIEKPVKIEEINKSEEPREIEEINIPYSEKPNSNGLFLFSIFLVGIVLLVIVVIIWRRIK